MNKNISKILLTVILSVWALSLAPGLYADGSRFQGGITFSMGFPQGDFKKNLDSTGFGVGLNAGVQLGHSPFIVGVDANILNYGSDKRTVYIDGIPELPLYVYHRYNIFQGLGFLRIQPMNRGVIRPYVEFLAGVNYLWAETSLEDDHHDWHDGDNYSTTSFDDASFCYGAGAGVLLQLAKTRPRHKYERGVEFLLDLRARFMFGGETQYLDEGSIENTPKDGVVYYYYESKTDLLNLQAGLCLRF